MCLRNILNDPNCLSYFVQFLENKNSLPLIKFYLDTENFRKAAVSQLQKEQRDSLWNLNFVDKQAVCDEQKQQCGQDQPIIKEENENQVPELKTLCDLSMRKPLTDDEKSQIYAETNKRIEFNRKLSGKCKYSSSSQLSLNSMGSSAAHDLETAMVTAASVKDALIIYQKYLSCDSVSQVNISI